MVRGLTTVAILQLDLAR